MLLHSCFTVSDIQFKSHRAMVRTEDFGVNRCCCDFISDPVGYQKIVDSPSCVVLTGIEAVTPPAVCSGYIGVSEPESIREACFQQLSEAFTLLVRETRIAAVAGGVLQIDLVVRHIQVTTGDDRLPAVQIL